MRIGIIGAGGISGTHVRAALGIDGVEVVAVHGHNPEKTAALAASAGAVAYQDLQAFLAHPMDMVAIGSPSGLHAEQAIAAARHGLHVLVEKPLDITTAKIDALLTEADRARVSVGVLFQERLAPEMTDLKARVDSGALGRPLLRFRARELVPSARVLCRLEVARHGCARRRRRADEPGDPHLDLLLYLCGPVVSVTGRVATRLHDITVEDTAAALLEFESGAFGVFEVRRPRCPVFLAVSRSPGRPAALVHEQAPRPADVADATRHRRVFEDFIDAMRTSRAPACDAREGTPQRRAHRSDLRSAKPEDQ